MALFASQPNAVVVGQAVACPGTAMFNTLRDVPMSQRLEFPVAEIFQLGFCTGIALSGGLPLCIFPRINFMLEAISQLVQHLDKIPLFSDYRPKVLIRTAIATPIPLDAGPQHLGDYTDAVKAMLSTVRVVRLTTAESVLPAYQEAINCADSVILVEDMGLY
jgi:pyruvate/2-oxoglutarate/acetoin dehydrogenase E1 component